MERATDGKEDGCSKDFCRQIPGRVLMNGNCPRISSWVLGCWKVIDCTEHPHSAEKALLHAHVMHKGLPSWFW